MEQVEVVVGASPFLRPASKEERWLAGGDYCSTVGRFGSSQLAELFRSDSAD